MNFIRLEQFRWSGHVKSIQEGHAWKEGFQQRLHGTGEAL